MPKVPNRAGPKPVMQGSLVMVPEHILESHAVMEDGNPLETGQPVGASTGQQTESDEERTITDEEMSIPETSAQAGADGNVRFTAEQVSLGLVVCLPTSIIVLSLIPSNWLMLCNKGMMADVRTNNNTTLQQQ